MSLHVHSSGDGPDLALIHGWGFPGSVWAPVLAPLAERFRVHCVDLPGYGNSPPAGSDSVQAIADQVMEVLPENVTLCGWSLGAHVALAGLARHSRRVRGLILVGATPCFVKRPDWPDGIDAAMLDLFVGALRADPAALLGRFAALINQGDASAREVTRTLAALALRPPSVETLSRGLDFLRELDLRRLLARIPHRALIIHGDRDPLMPLAAARWAAAALPRAQLEVFADTAHAPFISQPLRFAAAVTAFALAESSVDAAHRPC